MKKRQIQAPPLCAELAEDIGHHIGDGHMKIEAYDGRKRYRFNYSGDALLDLDYFENILLPRKRRLYGLDNLTIKSKSSALILEFSSVELHTLFVGLGVKSGKKSNIAVPEFIMTGSDDLKIAFLRGLFDSDGSLAFKKRHKQIKYYPTITISMKSANLYGNVKVLLIALGLLFTSSRRERYDDRFGRSIEYQIDINGVKRLNKWLGLIGFKNQRHLQKYEFWKLNGYYE
ncbi:LAGLIDADG family homing endonuclease [archaeon]